MDRTITLGEYEFNLIDENSFEDYQQVSESLNAPARRKQFDRALQTQAWFFVYIVKHNGNVVTRIDITTLHDKMFQFDTETNSMHRNLGHGHKSMDHLALYLRDKRNATRVQCTVKVDNKASNAMMRNTIFSLECTLKSYGVDVNNDPVDVNLYSVIF